MRISDWSSDVCSSDLIGPLDPAQQPAALAVLGGGHPRDGFQAPVVGELEQAHVVELQPGILAVCVFLPVLRVEENVALARPQSGKLEIGRASCRERVCQYV